MARNATIAAAYKTCFMLRVREFECRATWDFFDPVVVRLVTGTYCPDSKRPDLTICRIAVCRMCGQIKEASLLCDRLCDVTGISDKVS